MNEYDDDLTPEQLELLASMTPEEREEALAVRAGIRSAQEADPTLSIDLTSAAVDAMIDSSGAELWAIVNRLSQLPPDHVRHILLALWLKVRNGRDARF